jgi:hypothetical protein
MDQKVCQEHVSFSGINGFPKGRLKLNLTAALEV